MGVAKNGLTSAHSEPGSSGRDGKPLEGDGKNWTYHVVGLGKAAFEGHRLGL